MSGAQGAASSSSSSRPSTSSQSIDSLPAIVTGSYAQQFDEGRYAPDGEDLPMPAFLMQTRSDIHNKFIDLEWQQRHRIAAGMQPPSSADADPSPWARHDPSNPEIVRRNRYANVEPFASNRVRLRVPAGVSDYINASPIALTQTVSGAAKRYIATQGPKDGIESHIWRMVRDETGGDAHTAVMVMLTQTHEQGREKCFPYFPPDMAAPRLAVNERDEFGDGFVGALTLTAIEEDADARCTVRHMDLETAVPAPADAQPPSDTDASSSAPATATPPLPAPVPATVRHKPIVHLLFAGWPDFLVPEGADRAALLRLIALSAALNNNDRDGGGGDSADSNVAPPPPRIVHCSAGVGRSGTFIALDYLLQEIAEGAWDDVAAFDTDMLDVVGATAMPGVMGAADEGGGVAAGADAGAVGGGGGGGQRDSMILTNAGRARDPVLECVDALRKQRVMMVQGEAQFAFIYDVCREVWAERWRQRQREGRGQQEQQQQAEEKQKQEQAGREEKQEAVSKEVEMSDEL